MKVAKYLFFMLIMSKGLLAQKFSAGFSAGLVASDINGADTRDTDNDFHKLGVTFGGIVNFQLNKNNQFHFEINYIQKGSLQPPDSLNNGYFKIALGYIEIPILLKHQIYFNWKQKRVNKFDIEGGVSYGRMIHSKEIGNTNYVLPNASDYLNKNDISLLVGLDYNITKNIYFCLRYSNSVIPAIKKNAANYGIQSLNTINKGNNMVLHFSFKFLLNGKSQEASNKPLTPTVQ